MPVVEVPPLCQSKNIKYTWWFSPLQITSFKSWLKGTLLPLLSCRETTLRIRQFPPPFTSIYLNVKTKIWMIKMWPTSVFRKPILQMWQRSPPEKFNHQNGDQTIDDAYRIVSGPATKWWSNNRRCLPQCQWTGNKMVIKQSTMPTAISVDRQQEQGRTRERFCGVWAAMDEMEWRENPSGL